MISNLTRIAGKLERLLFLCIFDNSCSRLWVFLLLVSRNHLLDITTFLNGDSVVEVYLV